MKVTIYPSITTTRHDQLDKIAEASRLGITEVCFFATGIVEEERKVFYRELAKSKITGIPIVHLRSDMALWELDFLAEKFKTQKFICHPPSVYPFQNDLVLYAGNMFIENAGLLLAEEEVELFGGLSLDLSHLENDRLTNKENYEATLKIIMKFPVDCGQVSAIKKVPFSANKPWQEHYDSHLLESFSDLNYLKRYRRYFPQMMALELENSLEDQREIINYLSSKFALSSF